MKLFWKYWPLVIIFTSLSAFSVDVEQCFQSLGEVFNSPHHQESVQKYLKLQGKLTLHKLTYSLFQNDISENIVDYVFNNSCSLFYHLVKESLE